MSELMLKYLHLFTCRRITSTDISPHKLDLHSLYACMLITALHTDAFTIELNMINCSDEPSACTPPQVFALFHRAQVVMAGSNVEPHATLTRMTCVGQRLGI